MRNIDDSVIRNLIDRVNANTTGIFKRDSELIVTLSPHVASVIKSNRIYLSNHLINEEELKRLEHKFPVVFSSGETPNFSHACLHKM